LIEEVGFYSSLIDYEMNNIKLVDATQFKETEELINHINNVIKDDKKNMLVVRNINAISESE